MHSVPRGGKNQVRHFSSLFRCLFCWIDNCLNFQKKQKLLKKLFYFLSYGGLSAGIFIYFHDLF